MSYPYGANRNVKIFIGSDDSETRKEFSDLCGQKKVKNFSVNTNAENPASSNTGASNQSLITVGMLERLNGDEKGDAIVSVRGYEPIWSRFTPSYELSDVYFEVGKADIGKREARLFEKRDYVFDILGGSLSREEDKKLDAIEKREQEEAEADKKKAVSVADLDKKWEARLKEVHDKIFRVAEALKEDEATALIAAKLEDKITLIKLFIDNYDISVQQRLRALVKYLEQELPKLGGIENRCLIYWQQQKMKA